MSDTSSNSRKNIPRHLQGKLDHALQYESQREVAGVYLKLAHYYVYAGEIELAGVYYEKQIQIFDTYEGEMYHNFGDYEKARQWFTKRLELALTHDHHLSLLHSYYSLGVVCCAMSDMNAAMQHGQQAYILAGNIKNVAVQVSSLCLISRALKAQGNVKEAIIQLKNAESLVLSGMDDPSHLLQCIWNNLFLCYYDTQQYEEALLQYEKYQSSSQGDVAKQSQGEYHCGLVYKSIGKKEQAKLHFVAAVDLAKKANNLFLEVQSMIALGEIHLVNEDVTNAISIFQRALQLLQSYDVDSFSFTPSKTCSNLCEVLVKNAQTCLGLAFTAIMDYPKAIESHQKVLDIVLLRSDPIGIARAHSNLGLLYSMMKDYSKAIDEYQIERELLQCRNHNDEERSANFASLGLAYLHLAQQPSKQNDKDKNIIFAIQMFQQQRQLAVNANNMKLETNSCRNLGNAFMLMKDYVTSLKWFQTSLSLKLEESEEIETIRDIHRCLFSLNQNDSEYQLPPSIENVIRPTVTRMLSDKWVDEKSRLEDNRGDKTHQTYRTTRALTLLSCSGKTSR